MSIINSIYETTGAFTLHVKDTNNIILLRAGEIDSVGHIQEVSEMYNDNLDCRVFSYTLKNLINAGTGIGVQALFFFDFFDKHVVIKVSDLEKKNNLNAAFLKEEYTYIPKEWLKEIKGGLYKMDEEMISNLK